MEKRRLFASNYRHQSFNDNDDVEHLVEEYHNQHHHHSQTQPSEGQRIIEITLSSGVNNLDISTLRLCIHRLLSTKLLCAIIWGVIFVIVTVTIGILRFNDNEHNYQREWNYHNDNNNMFNKNYHENNDGAVSQKTPKLRHESIVVTTKCGTIAGVKEQGSYVFKGIPYAHPPIGHKRWSPPIPKCDSEGHHRATKFGSACFQINPYSGQFEGREDCLYLNIWTPDINEKSGLFPVMVWIHGGFLQFGSGHQPGLKPSARLSTSMKTTFVSLNYRLHVFGFLAMDNHITREENGNISSPNFGLHDLIVALQWINMNIRYFGGDPQRITLFGPDGGAALILALMSAPSSLNLFHSAWLIDPAVFFNQTMEESIRDNRKHFLRRTGCNQSIECLRALSSRRVIENFLGKHDPSFRINDQNDLPILGIMSQQLITVDDILVFDNFPFTVSTRGDIPLLIGSSAHAIEFWPGPRDLSTWTWKDYRKYVTTSLDSFGSRLSQMALEKYPSFENKINHRHHYHVQNKTLMSPMLQYITMVSDLRQICPINFMTQMMASKFKAPIWRYLITDGPSKPIRVYDYGSAHAFHTWELIAFFDNIETYIKIANHNDIALKETMQTMIKTFLNDHNNDINYNNSILWHSMPSQIATINDSIIEAKNYQQNDRCHFWENENFINYVWTV